MTPEQYWIGRGEDVIGTDVLRDGDKARQAATYQALAQWIVGHKVHDVLDVGCNVCALYWWLQKLNYKGDYLGVDTNPHALRVASENFIHVAEGNLRELTHDDREFQCVVVKDVIEHLEGPELLAEAFRESWKYVVVATYIPWTNKAAEIVQHPDGYYTNRYNYRDVVRLAAGWGFGLIEHDTTTEANGTLNQIWAWERQAVTP